MDYIHTWRDKDIENLERKELLECCHAAFKEIETCRKRINKFKKLLEQMRMI